MFDNINCTKFRKDIGLQKKLKTYLVKYYILRTDSYNVKNEIKV
jgi:hypothetical protein